MAAAASAGRGVARVCARVLRQLRADIGTREAVSGALQVGLRSVERYEARGGPFWYYYALRGLAAEAQRKGLTK